MAGLDMGPNNAQGAQRPRPMLGPPSTCSLHQSSTGRRLRPLDAGDTSDSPTPSTYVRLSPRKPVSREARWSLRFESSLTHQRVSLQRSTLLVPKLIPSRPLLTRDLRKFRVIRPEGTLDPQGVREKKSPPPRQTHYQPTLPYRKSSPDPSPFRAPHVPYGNFLIVPQGLGLLGSDFVTAYPRGPGHGGHGRGPSDPPGPVDTLPLPHPIYDVPPPQPPDLGSVPQSTEAATTPPDTTIEEPVPLPVLLPSQDPIGSVVPASTESS
ncbi:hypothetical protein K2173_006674 [Erythroxylum novogranatense]|uniref:Uncharacterized protein n=1 Tax=Erythroxylum novogranatense TaxID=1862640 RepID=A0AAV8SYK8_9ROSI|nr:hypothetical protein K2173_006674 [Erythroxylum novogranatense]